MLFLLLKKDPNKILLGRDHSQCIEFSFSCSMWCPSYNCNYSNLLMNATAMPFRETKITFTIVKVVVALPMWLPMRVVGALVVTASTTRLLNAAAMWFVITMLTVTIVEVVVAVTIWLAIRVEGAVVVTSARKEPLISRDKVLATTVFNTLTTFFSVPIDAFTGIKRVIAFLICLLSWKWRALKAVITQHATYVLSGLIYVGNCSVSPRACEGHYKKGKEGDG